MSGLAAPPVSQAVTLDIGGRQVEGVWTGTPGRHAVVLLHEGLGAARLWRDLPERLFAALGLPVFAWSRFGYGRSDPVTLPRPVTYMHTEAIEVMPHVLAAAGIERALLVGHSDGGSIALIHAGSGAAAGVALDGVVAIAAHVFNEDASVTGIEAARVAWHEGDLRDRLARHHADVDGAFLGWNGVWLSPPFRDWNIEAFLPGIDVPVLVIQGDQDEYGSDAQYRAIMAGLRVPAELVVLPGCGHSPHREAPDALVAAIARWWRSLAGSGSREERR